MLVFFGLALGGIGHAGEWPGGDEFNRHLSAWREVPRRKESRGEVSRSEDSDIPLPIK